MALLRIAFSPATRALSVALLLTGCSYGGNGPPAPHYLQFEAKQPQGNIVHVCSA